MGRDGTDGVADAEVTRTAQRNGGASGAAPEVAGVPSTVLPELPRRFEVRGLLGRGAGGVVVAAFDTVLEREVAVKVLGDGSGGGARRSREALLREARAAARLEHPGIVRVLEVDAVAGFIVMELVRGGTLSARIERGTLSAPEVRRLGRQILDALEAAHRAGVLHRDVKPSNILLDENGDARLADFGVARALGSEGAAGDVAGTPAFMAPECFAGKADARSDVFAVAATLFRAATGAMPPSDAREAAHELRLHAQDDGLTSAILRALDPDPAARFQGARAFSGALAPPAVSRAPHPFARPAASLAIAIVVVVVIGVAVTRVQPPEPASRGTIAPPRSVAVAPFEDRSGRAELDFTAEGLPYLVALDLSHRSELTVIGPSRLRDANLAAGEASLDETARRLGADGILDGSVQCDGERCSVRVRWRALTAGAAPEVLEADAAAAELGTRARELAGRLIGLPIDVEPRRGEPDLARAVSAMERHAFADAELLVGRALAASPDWADAHYVAALVAWWRGRPSEAVLEHVTRARTDDITADRRAFLDGLALVVGGRLVEAEAHFARALSSYPEDRDLRYGRFEALWHAGRGREAFEEHERLVSVAPRFQLGLDHVCAWAFAQADEPGLERCTRLAEDVGHMDLTLFRARAAAARRDPAGAIALLEAATTEDRLDLDAHWESMELLAVLFTMRDEPVLARAIVHDYATHEGLSPMVAMRGELGVAISTGAADAEVATLRAALRRHMVDRSYSYAAWLRYLALELALPFEAALPDWRPAFAAARDDDVRAAVVLVLGAGAEGDAVALDEARASAFEEPRLLGEGFVALARGEPSAAASAFAAAADLAVDARFHVHERHLEARARRAAGDDAGVIEACDAIVRPRTLDWSWAPLLRSCLAWSVEASEHLGDAGAAALLRARQEAVGSAHP